MNYLRDPSWVFTESKTPPNSQELFVGTKDGFGPCDRRELVKEEVLSAFYAFTVENFDHQYLDDMEGAAHAAMSTHLGDVDSEKQKKIIFRLIGENDKYSKIEFYWCLSDFEQPDNDISPTSKEAVLPKNPNQSDKPLSGEAQPQDIQSLSREPFGTQLVESIYGKLLKGENYYHVHRDYCGVGIYLEDGNVLIREVDDYGPGRILAIFSEKTEFIFFLAEQNDFTMSRACPTVKGIYTDEKRYQNNQTLKKHELEKWVKQKL